MPGFVVPPFRAGLHRAAAAALLLLAGEAHAADPDVVRVATLEELRAAAASAKPGTEIVVTAAKIEGTAQFSGLTGTAAKPIVIRGADPKAPPVFTGGAGFQLSDAVHVELRDLAFSGQTGNGVNIDDGGTPDTPAHHVTLRRLTVRDVGPAGNRDGIKLSGLADFRVEECLVERWGSGGSAVDMVGCRAGVIAGCTFRHDETGGGGASGVQAKGGTRDVTIRRNRFETAGARAVNAGGSTGLEYFRPPLAQWKGEKFEAKDLVIEGNTFVGGQSPVAFVGCDGAVFRFNTVYVPGKWGMRILQENTADGFVPCRNVQWMDNLIVFRSAQWSEGGVNTGPGTAPATFRFARNHWFCEDAPPRTRSLLRLPSEEKDGEYGKDPGFRDAAKGDLRVRDGSPSAKVGAHALPE